jgi:hypothetical protein
MWTLPEIVTMSEQKARTVNYSEAMVIARAKSTGAGRRLVGGEWLFSHDELVRFHDLLIATGMSEAATLCEGEAEDFRRMAKGAPSAIYDHKADAAFDLAALIRAYQPRVSQ